MGGVVRPEDAYLHLHLVAKLTLYNWLLSVSKLKCIKMGKLTETCAYLHLMGKLTNVRLKLQLWSIGHHCRDEEICFGGKVAMMV